MQSIADQNIGLVAQTLAQSIRTGQSEIELDDYLAIRVGRNQVWKLTPHTEGQGQSLFFKYYHSLDSFNRELAGLQVANSLARQFPAYLAPEVLFSDEQSLVVVINELSGETLAELMKAALRIDRNPLRKRGPIERVQMALTLTAEWLKSLREQSVSPNQFFSDHSLQGSMNRILSKISIIKQRELPKNQYQRKLIDDLKTICVAASAKLPCEEPVLVHGDLAPGNVIYNNGRIGVIDFEDFGVGDAVRDSINFREQIEPGHGRWRKWALPRLSNEIEFVVASESEEAVFRIEFCLNRLVHSICPRWNSKRDQARSWKRLKTQSDFLSRAITR